MYLGTTSKSIGNTSDSRLLLYLSLDSPFLERAVQHHQRRPEYLLTAWWRRLTKRKRPLRWKHRSPAQEATPTMTVDASTLVESSSSSLSSSSRMPTRPTPKASSSSFTSSTPPGPPIRGHQDQSQSSTPPLRRSRSSRSGAPLRRLIDLLRLLRHRSMDLLRSLAGREPSLELLRLFIKLFAITWFGLKVLEGLRIGREVWRGGRAIAAAGRDSRAIRVTTTSRLAIVDGGRMSRTTTMTTTAAALASAIKSVSSGRVRESTVLKGTATAAAVSAGSR